MDLGLLQVSAPGLAYICLGGFVVLFSMISLLVKEKLYINEVVLGTGFGVIIGPYVANLFTPREWGPLESTVTLEVMRIVLATGLFAVGVELPCAYMKEHAKSLLIMVVPTMAFGWVALFPELNYISSLCIAACLTPTDPVACAAITRGKFATKHVPVNIRRILSAESAANDGLAYPFLAISIYLTVETSVRTALGKWFLVGWLYQVILGTVLGAVLGLLFSKLMKLSHNKGFIDRESYVAQYLALSIFTIGIASTIGADDLLAAFAAGSAISWDGHFNVQTEDDTFSSVIDYVLNCGCFIYIGAWLPFDDYNSPEYGITPWKLVLLMIAILVLRRIPPLLALYKFVPEITSWKEALFSGHFGPMGVSAVFVSNLALTRLPTPEHPPANQAQYLAATIQPIVSFVVLGSIIVHGLSIPSFNMGRGVHSRTISLTMTWTSRNRVTVPDWVLWARAPDIVESSADEDVEQGSTKTPKGTDESAVIPDTGPSGATFEDVPGSVVTRRHSRGKDDSSPELVQVSTLFSINSPPN
ncbi:Sodium/hydrogen exchanger family-domain-containing protein [Suillus subaureus]|uniref:Sodium/hydrogen exchanger family-domain-containing protein n=1 Tax=Suillus subaureus TaxID=48587 RepID=A0A9P7EA98_9AGAM|nr:Sodium/hydrogen exchanger family-domain-containing protein [Suillus subaureus]KAG1815926.1 Sodium/hydrogen exchanger family-domain-containing protein [Suillus subaureus]